ncbi:MULTISPECIES: glutathione transferase GstA [unclassified Paludibacterium]|uniref:glutathione transferase GstA n=1 Tax=unclassified Paludibacterium TaxID=2618429 RepID=UPI001C04ABF4|nr:glutathione transferase GstA [Paludibacterium sp. B53371]BEV72784.1 glutathione transferase GstA [Paludibacterium sp. THUN1379]
MKLYYAPGACSLSVHIALAESGLVYQIEKVDIRAQPHVTASGQPFQAINPKGSVPALLLDNGELLTEGAAIVQYIADQVPEKQLAPANGTMARYRLQEWLNYIGSEVHKSFGPLFSPDTPEPVRQMALERLGKRLDFVAEHLSRQETLLPAFSVADGYLFTCLRWCHYVKLPLDRWPVLQAYQQRIAQRPMVQKVLLDEGLS